MQLAWIGRRLASSLPHSFTRFSVASEAMSIGTHNGKFHCDEAFACFMLKRMNEFKDHKIVRSRDPAVLDACDVVVDVGGVFDHEKKRYDHHQRGFEHTMKTLGKLDFHTKLSSAGLVYAHYGKQLIAEILGVAEQDPQVDIYYKKLYATYVEAIDAVDNGIKQYEGQPKYHMGGHISGRVGHLNPHWNEPENDADERFQKAMALVGGEFEAAVLYLRDVWWPAREIVEQAIDKRKEVDSSGRIICLDGSGGVPWKEHFFDLEKEKALEGEKMTYIVFGDSTANNFRVQAIPVDQMSSFENRLPLPAAWRGFRDADLSALSGVDGCIFVHMSGFIGGNASRDGAIRMARLAIEMESEAESNGDEVKRMKLGAQA